jgi:uncharacterized protein
MRELVRVSVYINEADEWHRRPLHLAILEMLHRRALAGGTVLRAVAGFTGKGGVQTTSLVDTGGKLPLVIQFIDTAEKVDAVIAELRSMVGARLIVRESVQAVDGPAA